MPGITDRRNKFYALDRELVFALYLRLGSYDKVALRLEVEGCVNPATKRSFSRSSLCTAAKRSFGWDRYFQKRLADPEMSDQPTQEEYDEAAKIIEERLPMQRDLVQKAEEFYREKERLVAEKQRIYELYTPKNDPVTQK